MSNINASSSQAGSGAPPSNNGNPPKADPPKASSSKSKANKRKKLPKRFNFISQDRQKELFPIHGERMVRGYKRQMKTPSSCPKEKSPRALPKLPSLAHQPEVAAPETSNPTPSASTSNVQQPEVHDPSIDYTMEEQPQASTSSGPPPTFATEEIRSVEPYQYPQSHDHHQHTNNIPVATQQYYNHDSYVAHSYQTDNSVSTRHDQTFQNNYPNTHTAPQSSSIDDALQYSSPQPVPTQRQQSAHFYPVNSNLAPAGSVTYNTYRGSYAGNGQPQPDAQTSTLQQPVFAGYNNEEPYYQSTTYTHPQASSNSQIQYNTGDQTYGQNQ